jgi:hypothetical protein
MVQLVLLIAAIVCGVFIFRLLGAWMFRINEIIKQLKEINNKLNK